MKELWRKIPGFRHYTVSSFGRIRNPVGKVLKFNKNYKGYLIVKLYPYGGGKARTHFVHRLVAKAFISNPNNLSQVNHKDHNPANNIISNLEWCTNTYNQRYSHALNVFQYSLDGNFIKKWDALSDIEKDLSIPTTNISKCCKGQILTINQFIFLYEGEDIVSRLEAIKNRWKCQNKKFNENLQFTKYIT